MAASWVPFPNAAHPTRYEHMTQCLPLVALMGTCCLVASCMTSPATYAPDGRQTYTLSCSGFGQAWDKCDAAAATLCGEDGYDVIDRSNPPAERATAKGSLGAFGVTYTRSNERSMRIGCKS